MRRTERLFQIIQILRRTRRPVTGRELADELETSLRTVYRDMAELIAQRVPIRGEAGMGYVIDSDFDMPPLMLTVDEMEAAVLGAAWVAQRGDPGLARGAQDLIAKLTEVVPADLRPILLDEALQPLTFSKKRIEAFDVGKIRAAIRDRRKITIEYADVEGQETRRTLWPFMIGYMEQSRMLCAWCELRVAFRHFRTDRIRSVEVLEEKFPERTEALRRKWKKEREAERRDAEAARCAPETTS